MQVNSKYKNQKVPLGVTLFSFIVMLSFFVYTNIIMANTGSLNRGQNKSMRTPATEKTGSVIGFQLPERDIVTLPDPAGDTKEEGKVEVEISVDKNGTVTGMEPGNGGAGSSKLNDKFFIPLK